MFELFRPYWISIIKYGGIALGFVLFYFKARNDGGVAEERKQAAEALKGVSVRNEIENDIARLSDDKLNKLYDKNTK